MIYKAVVTLTPVFVLLMLSTQRQGNVTADISNVTRCAFLLLHVLYHEQLHEQVVATDCIE